MTEHEPQASSNQPHNNNIVYSSQQETKVVIQPHKFILRHNPTFNSNNNNSRSSLSLSYTHTHTHAHTHTHTHTHTHMHTHTCTRTYTQNTGTHIHTSPPLSLNLHMSNANICLTQTDQDNVVSNRPKHKTLSLNQTVSPQTVHTLVVILKYQCERNLGITCSRHWTYSLASNSLRKGYIVMPYSTETKPTQRVMFYKCHTPLKPNQHRESCFTSVIRH